jgi:hypothetical protein
VTARAKLAKSDVFVSGLALFASCGFLDVSLEAEQGSQLKLQTDFDFRLANQPSSDA